VRNGNIARWLKELHEEHGDAVRVAPNEVSFISGETAWQDIYGFRTGKHKHTGPYLKDRSWLYVVSVQASWRKRLTIAIQCEAYGQWRVVNHWIGRTNTLPHAEEPVPRLQR
jgi:hypothetical protein